MSNQYNILKQLIRWHDWGSIKVPTFATLLAYISLSSTAQSYQDVLHYLWFFFFALLHTGLCFITNAWGDLEFDNLSGRSNPFRGITYAQGLVLIITLFFIAVLSGLPFIQQPFFIDLWLCWAFLNFTYSLHPFRFKQHNLLGYFWTVALQWTTPVFLTFAAMGRIGELDSLIFGIAYTISGATLELSHRRYDRRNDLRLNTQKFRIPVYSERLDQVYTAALFLDKTTVGLITVCIFGGLTPQFGLWLGIIPLISYLGILALTYVEATRALSNDEFLDPYYSNQRNANSYLHCTLPCVLIPSYLLLVSLLINPGNSIFLILFIVWQFEHFRSSTRNINVAAES